MPHHLVALRDHQHFLHALDEVIRRDGMQKEPGHAQWPTTCLAIVDRFARQDFGLEIGKRRAGRRAPGPRQGGCVPGRACVRRTDGTVAVTEGYASANFLRRSSVGATAKHALVIGLGYRILAETPANANGLEAIIATNGDDNLTFFFAQSVYVGNDQSTPHTESPAVQLINGTHATVAYGTRKVTYVLDRVPIHAT